MEEQIRILWPITFAIAIILLITIPILFRNKMKPILLGLITGIVIAVINTFALGLPGIVLAEPIVSMLSICSGEGCQLWFIIIGDTCFILLGIIVGLIIGKIKSKKTPSPQ